MREGRLVRGRSSSLTLLTLSWVLLACAGARAQTFTISGRVVDKDNRPAPGVRVTVQRGASVIDSKVTGKAGDYMITFPTGEPVTIFYAGGGWLPTKVQNLSGRINHSLGKVLSRTAETASLTPAEADDAASAFEYMRMHPSLYSREIAEYGDLHLTIRQVRSVHKLQYEELAHVPKNRKLPPGAKGFEQYATRDASDKLATGGATRDPPNDEFWLTMRRGDELYEAGKYREAAEHYALASKIKPEVFRAFYALGAAHEAAGQFKEAASAYKTATALKPDPLSDDPSAPFKLQYALANSQAASGQHAEAVTTYRQVIEQIEKAGARMANPYYNLALSLVALNRQQEAIAAFTKAVEIDPDYAEAHYNLGVIHSKTEHYAEAVEAFKKAIKIKPDYAEARYNLGLAYYLTDDRAGLREQQKALRSLDPRLAGDLAKLIGK